MLQPGIVVIEDDPAVNEGVAMILERSGYSVHSFPSAEAFEQTEFDPGQIYLIDWQLGGVDGIELCRRLRSGETTRHIHIIIMSGSPDARRYAKQAGSDAFLEKPFTKRQLLASLAQSAPPDATNES